MDARGCLFVCLCVCVVGAGVQGIHLSGNEGHGSICRANERFLSCGGCQKTCKDPVPDCKGVCRTGCYCNEDEVRNETGHCVKLANCPAVAPAKLQSSEPRHTDLECPPDEEYRSCEPCNKTCDNPNPICPAQCARGCFCRDDLVRDKDGRCVKIENCSNMRKKEDSNLIKPIPVVAYQLTCSLHQFYSSCRSCERTCSSATPVCRTPCGAGCFCHDGYLKAPDGQCVKLEDCPKAEVSFGGAQEPSIEDCSPDEIYLSCGWCEPSCWDPKPVCPRGVCTSGCLCRPPLLRHHSGQCVHEQDCTPQKCADPNEEFVCRYGCEARCDAKKCLSRPRRCVLGCHCRFGLYRDVDGKCVALDHCRLYNSSAPNIIQNFLNSSDTPSFPASVDGLTILGITIPDAQELEAPKSVFGPIPEDSEIKPLPEGLNNPFHEEDTKPYKDALTRAVKLYRKFLGNPSSLYSTNVYVPRTVKDMSPRIYRDDNGMITKEGLKANNVGNSQFFVNQESKPTKEANVKNYMSDLISVMKEMMPQPMNFTIVNYPGTVWSL